ncbi:MAG: 5'/3'-nucleotidase SurE, partial [Clostridia bacterium]
MEILLVNDDGIYAKGILTLAKVLSKKHNVIVVAPHKQMSGTGHSLTFNSYLNFQRLEIIDGVKSYVINGTPADCVKFGIEVILGHKPDVVLSGINNGFNLGTDVVYSGTVNASMEASILGVKSMALSQEFVDVDYSAASQFVYDNLERLCAILPDDNRTIWSINFPSSEGENYKNVKFTTVGWRTYDDEYKFEAPKGYYITGKPLVNDTNLPTSDEMAVV